MTRPPVTDSFLKQLANLPYGAAKQKLKEAGHWDESKLVSDEPREFTIRVHGERRSKIDAIVYVEACSVDEAQEKAEERASAPGFVWGDEWGWEDEVTDSEVDSG